LHAKEILNNKECYKWEPFKQLLNNDENNNYDDIMIK